MNQALDVLRQTTILNNSLENWIIALIIVVLFVVGEWLFRRYILRRLRILARRSQTYLDDFLADFFMKNINSWLMLIVGVYVGSQWLTLPHFITRVIYFLFILAVTMYGAFFLTAFLDFLIKRRLIADESKYTDIELRARQSLFRTFSVILKVLIWPLAFILVLDNMGYDVTGLIAGLGVGGIAIGLALQSVLQDIIASFSLQIDRPFVVGEWIQISNDVMGTVEHIGIKTTRVRSWTGEQLSIPNRLLTDSIIRNYGRIRERRATLKIGIVYETPIEKVQRVSDLLKQAVESVEKTRFEYASFKEFGDFSLDFLLVFYVLDPSYRVYLAKVEEVNTRIMEIFQREGIEFAYPTQMLYVQQVRESAPSSDGGELQSAQRELASASSASSGTSEKSVQG